MHYKKVLQLLSSCCLLFALSACNKQFDNDDYTAWFGGEVTNPANRYVLFCKDGDVLDSIPLNPDNTFLFKFDSLAPGLYSFRHDPEYQYVYFDKNDSLMVRINAQDFDESIVFCGRGEEKNNFLMELYLKNDHDRQRLFDVFAWDEPKFRKYVDSAYASKKKFYEERKEKIGWSEDFDTYALAGLNFPHYSQFEIYPIVQKKRLAHDMEGKLSKDYYGFRKQIDFNNPKLTAYSPFVNYLTYMLNNVAMVHEKEQPDPLDINITKLTIADTLFRNPKIKNTVLNNIAFMYLLEDQNMTNNKRFLDKYYQLSTDKSQHNEILRIGKAVQELHPGGKLPAVSLVDPSGNQVDINSIIKRPTVLFFWTKNRESHLLAAHKKALELEKKFPGYDFIAVNVDNDQEKWTQSLQNYKFGGITELRATDFHDLKDKWVITKIHRTMIINGDGTIQNAFVSLFDAYFEQKLSN